MSDPLSVKLFASGGTGTYLPSVLSELLYSRVCNSLYVFSLISRFLSPVF